MSFNLSSENFRLSCKWEFVVSEPFAPSIKLVLLLGQPIVNKVRLISAFIKWDCSILGWLTNTILKQVQTKTMNVLSNDSQSNLFRIKKTNIWIKTVLVQDLTMSWINYSMSFSTKTTLSSLLETTKLGKTRFWV